MMSDKYGTVLKLLRKHKHKNFSEVARLAGVHPSSVLRVAEKHGIPKRTNMGARNKYKFVLITVKDMLSERRPRTEVLSYIDKELIQ